MDDRLLLGTHALIWGPSVMIAQPQGQTLHQDDRTKIRERRNRLGTDEVRLGRLSWASPDSRSYCLGQSSSSCRSRLHMAKKLVPGLRNTGILDRMLAAQSALEGFPLATNDSKLQMFGVTTLW